MCGGGSIHRLGDCLSFLNGANLRSKTFWGLVHLLQASLTETIPFFVCPHCCSNSYFLMFIALGIYNLGCQQHLLQYCYNYKGIYIKNMNKTWRYGNCNKKEGLQYHLFYITIAGINCYLPISNSMWALKSAALGSAICKMIRPSTSKAGTILFPSIKNAVIGWKICKRSGLGVIYMPLYWCDT